MKCFPKNPLYIVSKAMVIFNKDNIITFVIAIIETKDQRLILEITANITEEASDISPFT